MTRMDLNTKVRELNKQYPNPEPIVFTPIYNTPDSNVLAQYLDETPNNILTQQLAAWLASQNVGFSCTPRREAYTELEVEVTE